MARDDCKIEINKAFFLMIINKWRVTVNTEVKNESLQEYLSSSLSSCERVHMIPSNITSSCLKIQNDP